MFFGIREISYFYNPDGPFDPEIDMIWILDGGFGHYLPEVLCERYAFVEESGKRTASRVLRLFEALRFLENRRLGTLQANLSDELSACIEDLLPEPIAIDGIPCHWDFDPNGQGIFAVPVAKWDKFCEWAKREGWW